MKEYMVKFRQFKHGQEDEMIIGIPAMNKREVNKYIKEICRSRYLTVFLSIVEERHIED